jgi:4-coumarate--CoA ligase
MLDAIGEFYNESGQIYLGVVPFFHILGLTALIFHAASNNCSTITLSGFEPVEFVRTIEKYKVTALLVVPPILLALVRHPGKSKSRHFHQDQTKVYLPL